MKSMLEPLPVTSYTVPSNWIFRMGGQEEVEAFVAEWEAPNQNDWIQPGAVQAGFSIRVPKDDATYINSHFTVYIQGKGSPSDLLVVEESPDLPPELTVLLSPNSLWPPNNKMVEITATISTKDDKDTNPVVKLLSITCNDGCDIGKDIAAKTGLDTRKFSVRASRLGKKKDGRQYTVTYTATDFGGNTTTKSAVVSIPHDQGNK